MRKRYRRILAGAATVELPGEFVVTWTQNSGRVTLVPRIYRGLQVVQTESGMQFAVRPEDLTGYQGRGY